MNSVTREPVTKALIEANGKIAMTDAEGHFEIDGLAGPYVNVFARRPGYDQQNPHDARIRLDSNVENLALKLVPLSRISGRVLDRDGEPIEGVSIQCIAQQIINGRKQWQPRNGAITDETGSYLIENVSAGTFILGTQEKQLYVTQPKSEAARYVYPPTFYPESQTREQAQHIDVSPGSEMKADISLQSVRGARVTFTTVPAFEYVIASMMREEDPFGGNQALAGKSGELTFPAVPPGSWKIVARGPFNRSRGESNEQPMYGEMEVEVGSADIDNLKLPLNKVVDIPITLSGPENAHISLYLLSKTGMQFKNGSNQEPNGELKIRNVEPGTYRAIVPLNGSESCVTSVTSGGQDLLHNDLVVSARTTIQVVVGGNCPQLTLRIKSDQPGVVLITSDDRDFEPQMVTIGGASGLVVKGLPEGDYKVYAFDDGNNLEYANPDALRDFKSQAIHLETGQNATVQLERNERHAK